MSPDPEAETVERIQAIIDAHTNRVLTPAEKLARLEHELRAGQELARIVSTYRAGADAALSSPEVFGEL